MSRAAFFNALVTDPYLNSIGIDEDSVFHNYSSEERPRDDGPFIILRWQAQSAPRFEDVKSPQPVRLWVHWPYKLTNDYFKLVKILDEIDSLTKELRDIDGEDGYSLAFVEIGDRSDDIWDDGFQTIAKHAGYQVHSQRKG